MRNRNTTANDNRVNGGNSNTNGQSDQNPNITERDRANAQHSTGPRTDEGKAASAKNAVRDGLSIPPHVVLKTEDPAAFERLRIELRNIYQPQSDREALAVDDLAQSRWAILRCVRAELKTSKTPSGNSATPVLHRPPRHRIAPMPVLQNPRGWLRSVHRDKSPRVITKAQPS